ncbi:MAG TPA: PQQ-binding-like beta-propeller repeat protein, partial [Candidatus Limnocylindrales bacterium]
MTHNNAARILTVLLVAAVAGCAPEAPSDPASPAAVPSAPDASGPPAPSARPTPAGPPALADVPSFRGDAARSSIHPGPGPIEAPVVAWERELGSQSTFFPILVGGNLIVGTDDGSLLAIDAQTGADRWSAEGVGTFEDAGVAVDGIVIAPDGDGILAVDASDGSTRWRYAMDHRSARPAIADGIVYIGSTDGRVVGLDVTDGSERWSWQGTRGVAARVDLVHDGVVYVSMFDGRVVAVELDGQATRWTHRSRSALVSNPVIAGDTIYISNPQGDASEPLGEIAALDVTTGEVRWRFSPPSGLQAVAGAVRDGIIYVNTTNDGVFALRDTGSSFDVVWQADAPRSTFPAALVGDILYTAGSDGGVTALRTSDGTQLWSTDAGGDDMHGPIVSGGLVLFTRDVDGIQTVRAMAEPAVVAALPDPAPGSEPSGPPAASGDDPFTRVAAFDADTTTVSIPISMDAGPDGLLYVLDDKPSVVVIDPATGEQVRTWGRHGSRDGEFDLQIPDEENVGLGHIDVADDGTVYVSDGANARVQVFAADGTYLRQFGRHGDAEGQFSRTSQVLAAGDGSVFVHDADLGYLTKFDPQGAYEWRIGGGTGPTPELRTVYSYALLADGRIVGFPDEGGPGVVVDPADGQVVGRWGPSDLGWSPEISLDPDGRVYLFQYVAQGMRVFDPDGVELGSL